MNINVAKMAVAASLMAGGTTFGDSLTYNGVVGGLSDTLAVTIPANGSQPGYSYGPGGVYIGFYQYTVGSGSAFNSFCIDFYDDSTTATKEYTAMPLASAPSTKFGNVAMGSGAATTIEALWAMNYGNASLASANNDNTVAAALQLAIWKAIAIGEGGTATGSTYEATAETMLAGAGSYSGPLPSLFAWSNDDGVTQYQDYIGVPDGGTTLALLGLGMGSLAFIARRARR